MELLYIDEHLKCFNYDHSKESQIEVVNYLKGEKIEFLINTSQVVFFLEGCIRYKFYDFPECTVNKGNFLFLPMGYECTYYAENNTKILIIRLYNPIKFCESYFVERLFNPESDIGNQQEIKVLEINTRVWQFISSLIDCINDGVKCKHYFDLKIKEFFLMLRVYYPKNELRGFLSIILSKDTAFSEYVRINRNKYSTVAALAKSMNLTLKQFNPRFKRLFGRTPYDWIKEGKTLAIHHEITATKKPIKQIAIEAGFVSMPQFTRYCKREFRKTPTDLRDEVS